MGSQIILNLSNLVLQTLKVDQPGKIDFQQKSTRVLDFPGVMIYPEVQSMDKEFLIWVKY